MADASKVPPLRLGIAGLGTVGAGLVNLIEQQSARLSVTLGRAVRVTGVSAR
jgi:homoserine dehydrogenase